MIRNRYYRYTNCELKSWTRIDSDQNPLSPYTWGRLVHKCDDAHPKLTKRKKRKHALRMRSSKAEKRRRLLIHQPKSLTSPTSSRRRIAQSYSRGLYPHTNYDKGYYSVSRKTLATIRDWVYITAYLQNTLDCNTGCQ